MYSAILYHDLQNYVCGIVLQKYSIWLKNRKRIYCHCQKYTFCRLRCRADSHRKQTYIEIRKVMSRFAIFLNLSFIVYSADIILHITIWFCRSWYRFSHYVIIPTKRWRGIAQQYNVIILTGYKRGERRVMFGLSSRPYLIYSFEVKKQTQFQDLI